MIISSSQPTGQIAVEVKETIPIFEKYGINYYTEGDRSLKVACFAASVPLIQVQAELEKVASLPTQWPAQELDWRQETMAYLIHYIAHIHHVKTRLELDNIEKALAKFLKDGNEPVRLEIIRTLFLKLDAELRDHLGEEEQLVFPYLIAVERALRRGKAVEQKVQNFKGFSNLIRNVLFEHGMMDNEFKEINKLIFLFKESGDGISLAALAESFKELEKDNEKHIHLENNILLKKAAELGLIN